VTARRRSSRDDLSGRLWVEEGEPRFGLIAEVAPRAHVHRTFSYAVPQPLEAGLAIGRRVLIPLGRRGRLQQGFVVALDHGPWDSTLRPVHSLVDAASFLTPELVALGREIADHYCCRLGSTLAAMTPEAVRQERGLKTVRYIQLARPADEILGSRQRVGAKRRAVVAALAEASGPVAVRELLQRCEATSAVIQSLHKQGHIEIVARKEAAVGLFGASKGGETYQQSHLLVEPSFALTDEQKQAIESIRGQMQEQRFGVVHLFGVSGSGKTEVYIHLIRHALSRGRQAILLVPEIMLTTQLVQRVASRFPEVAVIHSGLSEKQRATIWRAVSDGSKRVVIGTRSAVFAPCPRLGLLIVDEEQESTYKNLRAPRFHVRDVAVMRARQRNIPVVLGSATPSLETWYRSEHDPDYRRVLLRRRVLELPMPKVYVVDMRDEYLERGESVVLSRLMVRLLSETLGRQEQAIILMNRRGFAQRIYCPGCNSRLCCPNCNVGLVMHTASGFSICHYCRERMVTPTVCPNVTCGRKPVHHGPGTQKVEELLRGQFPRARIQRVDSDTMKRRDQYQAVIDRFSDRKLDILIGTQMIAKGLDFPAVSFVGIVDAEATGLAADFRAHERLFQLVTQTAGRAGRADASGRVVVQTMVPHMPALRFALQHDYESFAAQELGLRERIGLPPFRRLTRILVTQPREERARKEAEAVGVQVRTEIQELRLLSTDVLGPQPCLLSRLRGQYRYDLLLRTPDAMSMRALLDRLVVTGSLRPRTGSMVVDVDPVSLS